MSSCNLKVILKLTLFQIAAPFSMRDLFGWEGIFFSCSRTFSESHHATIQISALHFLQEDAEVTKAFEEDIETPPIRNIPSPGQLDPDTRIPVINLEDGTRLMGEDAPKNKDLVDWLKMHPTYTVDMPSYVPVSTAQSAWLAGLVFIFPKQGFSA